MYHPWPCHPLLCCHDVIFRLTSLLPLVMICHFVHDVIYAQSLTLKWLLNAVWQSTAQYGLVWVPVLPSMEGISASYWTWTPIARCGLPSTVTLGLLSLIHFIEANKDMDPRVSAVMSYHESEPTVMTVDLVVLDDCSLRINLIFFNTTYCFWKYQSIIPRP